MTFVKILEIAKRYNYFTPLYSRAANSKSSLQLGNSGLLLKENIKFQWILSNMLQTRDSVHFYDYRGKKYSEKKFHDSYRKASDFHKNSVPFEIIEIYENDVKDKPQTEPKRDISLYYTPFTTLSSSTLIAPHDAIQYFFNWQRQRKLWWKKISASPERFHLKSSQSNPDDSTIDIVAKFPWENYVIETITMSNMDNVNEIDKNKSNLPVRVCSKTYLETAFVALFHDGFEFSLCSDDTTVFRLNKILAPYKCIFAADETSAFYKDLLSLALHLTDELKKNGITSVLRRDRNMSLEEQFQRNDEWGIPYTIFISDDSLNTGIVNIRCRDTTLKEEVHICDLIPYILFIFNSNHAAEKMKTAENWNL